MYIESDVNAKFDVFWIFFYYYDTIFFAKTECLRKSGKIGSQNELKTPVKRFQFGFQMDLPGIDLDYTENYRSKYRKAIRETKTRENDRFIKDW